jgi:hypothetical protein
MGDGEELTIRPCSTISSELDYEHIWFFKDGIARKIG